MSAVAGATTTRSACRPMRTCGTSWASSQTSVATGRPDSAAQVGAPTNCSAAAVGTTRTPWPDSVNSRSSSQALYAAMPPHTPSTTSVMIAPTLERRKPASGTRTRVHPMRKPPLRGVGRLGGEQPGVDLAHRDGERLLLRSGLDQGADVLQQTLTELAVVRVDLAGALGREDHQGVLRRRL